MRLTAELVGKSTSFMNALGDWELDLRSNRIPATENLAVTRDQYDTIDLTDNDLRRVENLPTLKRLHTLLLSRNRIESFQEDIAVKLPAVETIVLSGNEGIKSASQLTPLSRCKSLRYLALLDCPLSRASNYRLQIIALLPQLTVLDYQKVKQVERQAADRLKKRIPLDELSLEEPPLKKLRPEDISKIQEAIRNASSLDEIQQLERILATGHVPN